MAARHVARITELVSTLGTPNSGLGVANFGLSTQTATAERQIQFGLRLMF